MASAAAAAAAACREEAAEEREVIVLDAEASMLFRSEDKYKTWFKTKTENRQYVLPKPSKNCGLFEELAPHCVWLAITVVLPNLEGGQIRDRNFVRRQNETDNGKLIERIVKAIPELGGGERRKQLKRFCHKNSNNEGLGWSEAAEKQATWCLLQMIRNGNVRRADGGDGEAVPPVPAAATAAAARASAGGGGGGAATAKKGVTYTFEQRLGQVVAFRDDDDPERNEDGSFQIPTTAPKGLYDWLYNSTTRRGVFTAEQEELLRATGLRFHARHQIAPAGDGGVVPPAPAAVGDADADGGGAATATATAHADDADGQAPSVPSPAEVLEDDFLAPQSSLIPRSQAPTTINVQSSNPDDLHELISKAPRGANIHVNVTQVINNIGKVHNTVTNDNRVYNTTVYHDGTAAPSAAAASNGMSVQLDNLRIGEE